MPCKSDYPLNEQLDDARKKGRDEGKKDMESLLCSACRVLERHDYDFDENPKLSEWWDKHKREDAEKEQKKQDKIDREKYRKRIAKEALAKPLNLLTQEEKTILKELGYI